MKRFPCLTKARLASPANGLSAQRLFESELERGLSKRQMLHAIVKIFRLAGLGDDLQVVDALADCHTELIEHKQRPQRIARSAASLSLQTGDLRPL